MSGVADAVGRGQWDWWIVAVLVVAVLVAQVVAVVTRGPYDWWLVALLVAVVVGVSLAAVLTRGPEREDER